MPLSTQSDMWNQTEPRIVFRQGLSSRRHSTKLCEEYFKPPLLQQNMLATVLTLHTISIVADIVVLDPASFI